MPRPSRIRSQSRERSARTLIAAASGGGGGTTSDPSTINGKQEWARAKDHPGANGSSVSTVLDQSGLTNNMVATGTAPTVITNATPNNGRALRFSQSPVRSVVGLQYRQAATASSVLGAAYPPFYLMDGTNSHGGLGWASAAVPSTGSPVMVTLQPATATTATSVQIYSDQTSRLPKDFKVQGSMDGSAFTDLATVTGASSSSPISVSFTNSTAHTYYRLRITANQTSDICQIHEITFNNTANPTKTGADFAGEVWAVVRGDSSASWADWWGSGDTWYCFGGVWYDDFGYSGGRISFTPTLSINTWRLLRIQHDGTLRRYWMDNVLQYTSSAAFPLWENFIQIGNGKQDIAEWLVLDTVSNDTQTANLIAYFNSEHGLTVT